MTKGWHNESQRHSLAARGIRTTMRSGGVVVESISLGQASDYFDDFQSKLDFYEGGLAGSIVDGDIGSMQQFVVSANDVIDLAENLGLGRENYIKNVKKARNNVERALGDEKFMYKYLEVSKNLVPFFMPRFIPREIVNRAKLDMNAILYDNSYMYFKTKLHNMKLRTRVV